MSWLTEHQRLIGRCAWVAAWVGLVVGQLHALSRFATAEGAEDLALPATAAWAVQSGLFRPVIDRSCPLTIPRLSLGVPVWTSGWSLLLSAALRLKPTRITRPGSLSFVRANRRYAQQSVAATPRRKTFHSHG
jgi:hypothetical protein